MSTDNWMELLAVAMLTGVFVSTSTHAALCRVRTRNPSSAPHQWPHVGSPSGRNSRDAAQELALLITLDPSRIDLQVTDDHEVHCSIQASPAELLELSRAAEAAIDQAFRERHRWADLRVVLQLEASPRTNVCPPSET